MSIKERAIELYKAENQKFEKKDFNAVSEQKIKRFENKYQVQLDPHFKEWLFISNGSNVGPGGLFGIETGRKTNDIEYYLELHPNWSDLKYIPIASDGFGNTYLVNLSVGKTYGFIFFIDSYEEINKPTYYVASNFWSFLYFSLNSDANSEDDDDQWPFNKRKVLSVDPGIQQAPKALLPWNLPD